MDEKNGCSCSAKISEEDPRYEIWKQVTPNAEIPLKHPLMHRHPQFGLMYEGDPQRLTQEQRELIADLLSKKFNIPQKEVLRYLNVGIMPVKAENCMVSICDLHVRCMI